MSLVNAVKTFGLPTLTWTSLLDWIQWIWTSLLGCTH